MARVSCKHWGCNKSFTSKDAMLQHFADSHALTAATQYRHVSSCADHVARVSCKHWGCNKAFTSKDAMLQHFADSHALTATTQHRHVSSCADHVATDADRLYHLQCHKCGRSFHSKPAVEQHRRDTSHDLQIIPAMVSSPPAQQALASRIRPRFADVGNINDILSLDRLMAAMLISGGTRDIVVGSRPLKPSPPDRKDQIEKKEILMMKKVSCDDCGDSFDSFDALHQHQWDKPYHTRVSRLRMPVFGCNVRGCSQCAEVCIGADELEQHYSRAHPLTEIAFTTGYEHSTDTWMHVADKFKLAWRRPITMAAPLRPVVHKIFKVNNTGGRRRHYEEYRAELKREMAQIKQLEAEEEGEHLDVRRRVLDDGNELRQRYHGTTVKCNALGRLQSGAGRWPSDRELLCSIDGCGLCGILKEGFRTARCRVSRFQRFGRGVYVSATSSKADDYVRMNHDDDGGNPLKVMLIAKVLAGRMYRTTHNLTHLGRPPPSFHSVQGVPGPVLNYDELVLYDDRAILPHYVIFYSLSHVGAPLG